MRLSDHYQLTETIATPVWPLPNITTCRAVFLPLAMMLRFVLIQAQDRQIGICDNYLRSTASSIPSSQFSNASDLGRHGVTRGAR